MWVSYESSRCKESNECIDFTFPTIWVGLEPVQTKKGKGCNKKCNKKQFKGSGLKILK